MRFADRLFRQGHLSEDAITAAVLNGARPGHLDRCGTCAERAFELGRWLDQMRTEAIAAADAASPPERLAVQHNQILRRIAQIEQPVRVIEFPRQRVAPPASVAPRRVSPGWLGVAAAAGLLVGVVSGHFSARLGQPDVSAVTAVRSAPVTDDVSYGSDAPFGSPGVFDEGDPQSAPTGLLDLDLDGAVPPWLQPLDENTPRLTQVALN